ncbi:ALP1-like protein [Tanacetum coccineum]
MVTVLMTYFSEHPQYDEPTFRERFRMSRRLFTKIVREVPIASLFFQQTNDCTGKVGISALMKCTFAIRQMAYEAVPDSLDECKWVRHQPVILSESFHEAARKDVERAFGVLKSKWKLIKYPARGMSRRRLSDVMYTCIILHNMIIHDNGEAISPNYFPEEQHRDDDPVRTHEESIQVT